MLFMLSGLGIVGAVGFAIAGLSPSGTELERILAVVCAAMAAAGIVGGQTQRAIEGRTDVMPRLDDLERLSKLAGAFMAIAAAPILAIMIGAFVGTLIPSVFVLLPLFAIVWLVSPGMRGEHAPAPAPAPLPAPAIA